MRYENIHKHSHYSNIFTPDSIITPEDIAKRAVELGHKTLSTVEHGYAGNVFEYYDVAKKYGLKMVFGVEFYYVHNRFEKDKTNAHLLILAKTNKGKRDLTSLISKANLTGYYHKPRIDKELLFSLDPKDVVVTSTCIASPYNLYDDECFIIDCHNHFGDSFFLELHDNTHIKQIEYNQKLLDLHNRFEIPFIFATDTHYIYEEDAQYRDILLRGKGIFYPEEEGFIMDYPTSEQVFERFDKQGVFTRTQIESALENTHIVDDFEEIQMNKEIKMPSIYPDLTHEQKMNKLKEIINKEWVEDRKHIDKSRHKEYLEAIKFEMDIIDKTHTEDYFLLNYPIIKKAKEKGGVLTRTGRGCFTKDALVHTKDGLKPISEVVVGDYVVNMYGEFDEVIKTWEYDINEDLIKIKHLFGTDKYNPTICTKDHKILVKRGSEKPRYIQAEFIKKGDYVCLPKIKNNDLSYYDVIDLNDYNIFSFEYDDGYIYEEYKRGNSRFNKKVKRFIQVDEMFNKFIGLMYADGCTSKKRENINGISLALNTDNHKNTINRKIFEEIANRLGLEVSENKAKNKNLTQLSLNSKVLGNLFVEEFFKSKKDEDKKFNSNLFNQTDSNLNAIREGMFLADGSFSTSENRESYDSTSSSLINAYKLLCLMTNKQPHSLIFRSGGKDSRGYNRKDSYKLRARINSDTPKKSNRYLEDDGYFYLPVKSIENLGRKKTKVYDLQVKNNPSFLINNMIVHNSAPSYYLNKLLGFTEVDRLDAPITLYPTRFMSVSRILETKSLPDIDYNTANPEPFIQATKEILGEDNCYYMTAYGTMQESEAFRNLCRALEIDYDITNKVAKDFDRYRNDKEFGKLIEQSKRFIGVIDSVSPHACANLLLSQPISEEVGVIRVGSEDNGKKKITYCAVIDSDTSDAWKYLKNDYLTVTVWDIISKGFEAIGQPIPDVRTLTKLVENDDEVWKLYEKGLTATLNQTGTDSGTPQVIQYKPRSIRELSGWVSAIRPAFASMKHYFLNRRPFTYGIPELDAILKESDNFILYQENIMATLVYAGFPEDETYGLLKAISKKKEGIIEPIHDKFINGFIAKTGSEENAKRVWKIIEDAVGYGFNSSHAYSVALDSIYGAYLKAKYPLEYYAVVLNKYEKDTTMQGKIMRELPYFNINVAPIEYGKSRAHYSADHSTNLIFKGVASIKNMNVQVSEELYELAQRKTHDSFIDLLVDIRNETGANKTHMETLIRLNYFAKFGQKEKLLELYQTFKEGRDENGNTIHYDKKHVEKTRIKRIAHLKEIEERIMSEPDKKIDLFEQIAFEKDALGYAITTMDVNPNLMIVMNIDKKYKPKVFLYQISTGKEYMLKVDKGKFYNYDEDLLYVGDIIKILKVIEKPAWKKIDNKWVEDHDRMEAHLEKCKLIRKSKLR